MTTNNKYENLPFKLTLDIPFQCQKHIDIVLKSSIVTDELINIDNNIQSETSMGDINKFVIEYFTVENVLSLRFHSIDIRLLRLISNNLIENVKLSIECIDEFQ
ncbi:hypothetical protein QEN19_004227 [Hanseniaspora menglaensis]